MENPNGKRFLLFLPENENHEISLLFANYLLKIHGHKVLYLGQSQPLADLKDVAKTFEPDYLFAVFTSSLVGGGLQKMVKKIGETFKDKKVLLTGFQVIHQSIDIPKNIEILPNPDSLLGLISDFKSSKELVNS